MRWPANAASVDSTKEHICASRYRLVLFSSCFVERAELPDFPAKRSMASRGRLVKFCQGFADMTIDP
jgi:hypothetical protein